MSHVIAGYTIDLRNRIGRGAFGTIFHATDSEGTKVAAKEIEKDSTSRECLREIENANKQKQLDHGNIVKILDTYSKLDDVWMFLEFCNRGDLNNYAKQYFPEFTARKISIMKDREALFPFCWRKVL